MQLSLPVVVAEWAVETPLLMEVMEDVQTLDLERQRTVMAVALAQQEVAE
jgi:hypothetical protein